MVQASRDGLCIGVALDAQALRTLGDLADSALYTGHGLMSRAEIRMALRLWREAQAQGPGSHVLRPLLLHVASLQRNFSEACSAARGVRACASARCLGACSVPACTWRATATAWCASASWPS